MLDLLEPRVKIPRRERFVGDIIKTLKEKLYTKTMRTDFRLAINQDFIMDLLRLEMISIFLTDDGKGKVSVALRREYSRNKLVSMAIRLFVNYFDQLLLDNHSIMPPLGDLVDMVSARQTLKDIYPLLEWKKKEKILMDMCCRAEPFPNKTKEIKDPLKYKEFWTKIFQEAITETKQDESYFIKLALLKRLIIYLEERCA